MRINSVTEFVGVTKFVSPTEKIIPSIIASVRGIFIVIVEPCPSTLSMSSTPPTCWIFLTTTSIPAPLPEYSVTFFFVEKPGTVMKLNISFSVRSFSVLFPKRPFAFAFSRISSFLRPLPLSDTDIHT